MSREETLYRLACQERQNHPHAVVTRVRLTMAATILDVQGLDNPRAWDAAGDWAHTECESVDVLTASALVQGVCGNEWRETGWGPGDVPALVAVAADAMAEWHHAPAPEPAAALDPEGCRYAGDPEAAYHGTPVCTPEAYARQGEPAPAPSAYHGRTYCATATPEPGSLVDCWA